MKIQINIEKQHLIILVAAILVSSIGAVIAFGGTAPATMGHSVEEISGLKASLDRLNGCQICWSSTGSATDQCSVKDEECASINTWTSVLMDDSDGRTGGCNFKWKIKC